MPTAILKEALAGVGGAEDMLEEPLTRRERWSLGLTRFGLSRGSPLSPEKRRDPILLTAADGGFQRSLSRSIKEFPVKEAVA